MVHEAEIGYEDGRSMDARWGTLYPEDAELGFDLPFNGQSLKRASFTGGAAIEGYDPYDEPSVLEVTAQKVDEKGRD